MKFLILAIVAFPSIVFAAPQCWEVKNLNGQVALAEDNYQITADGFRNLTSRVVFNGKQSTVSEWDINCFETPAMAVMCVKAEPEKVAIEVWRIDVAKGKATMSRIRSGFGIFDSAGTFVGDATQCK